MQWTRPKEGNCSITMYSFTVMANYSWRWSLLLLKDAVATVDVLIASNNEVKLVNTRTVHFAWLKSLFCFKRINKLDRNYSYWEILFMFAPWHTTRHWFYPNNPKASSNDGGWMVQMLICVGKNLVALGRSSVIHCKYDIMWTAVICSTTFVFMLSCIFPASRGLSRRGKNERKERD